MSVTTLDTSSWTPAKRQATARDASRVWGFRLSGAELRLPGAVAGRFRAGR